jgi:hypothetical protein
MMLAFIDFDLAIEQYRSQKRICQHHTSKTVLPSAVSSQDIMPHYINLNCSKELRCLLKRVSGVQHAIISYQDFYPKSNI